MANIEGIIFGLQHRDRAKDKVVPPRITTAEKPFTVFELILHVVALIVGSGYIVPEKAKTHLNILQKHFGFATLEETSLLCAFLNLCDDTRIKLRDLAQVYKVHTLNIVNLSDSLDDLVRRQFVIRRKDSEGNTMYRMTEEVIRQVRNGQSPHPKDVNGLDVMGFCTEVEELLERRRCEEIENDALEESINYLIKINNHLHISKTLLKYDLDFHDLLLLLIMMDCFINKHDDNITKIDIEDYFNYSVLRHHCYSLETGDHILMRMELVEHSCSDGQVSPTEWKLTEETKHDLLKELNIKNYVTHTNLTPYADIVSKKLYYNDHLSNEVRKLHTMLCPRRMKRILDAMESKGMRKGFTCLFYGAPGTGKTETVLQLARETKRDVMLVDVPNIRSKWVGESEKHIKRVFDNYRSAVRTNPSHAPMLVFNEADAIFTRRNEGGTSGIDKMENAMQNIILQELENLEGIMIATTNLTGNLDAAFERRFLYKLEFVKPSEKERCYIWKSMLSGLSMNQARVLAKNYDFSGAQIENIARKRIVNDILSGSEDIDMQGIIESCDSESIFKNNKKIGFT